MEVKVYSTAGCAWCKKVKAFLKENDVKYKSIDVGKDEAASKEMTKKSGQIGVPVTEIDGKIVIGFDEEKLKKALEI